MTLKAINFVSIEPLKERRLGEDRFGDTKTDESDSYVPVPPYLCHEISEWIAGHPQHDSPRAFLFLNRRGTAFSVGKNLKKQRVLSAMLRELEQA